MPFTRSKSSPRIAMTVSSQAKNASRGKGWSRTITKDGYEATFATNHLSYFVLTDVLLPTLEKAKSARIVNVASEAHRRGEMRFDDLQGEKKWSGFGAYCQSKLANILFSAELARWGRIPYVVFFSDACRTAAQGIQAQGGTGIDIFPN